MKNVQAKKKGIPGKNNPLLRFWNVAQHVGGFAYDFECVDAEGRPCKEAMLSRPILLSLAPVKAPLSCPNNSLSNTPSAKAAQERVTKGLSLRGLY